MPRAGSGWYSYEVFQGLAFRWASNDAEVRIAGSNRESITLSFIVEPKPGLNGKLLNLQIFRGIESLASYQRAWETES